MFRGCTDFIASQNSKLSLNKETSSSIILNACSGKDGYEFFNSNFVFKGIDDTYAMYKDRPETLKGFHFCMQHL